MFGKEVSDDSIYITNRGSVKKIEGTRVNTGNHSED